MVVNKMPANHTSAPPAANTSDAQAEHSVITTIERLMHFADVADDDYDSDTELFRPQSSLSTYHGHKFTEVDDDDDELAWEAARLESRKTAVAVQDGVGDAASVTVESLPSTTINTLSASSTASPTSSASPLSPNLQPRANPVVAPTGASSLPIDTVGTTINNPNPDGPRPSAPEIHESQQGVLTPAQAAATRFLTKTPSTAFNASSGNDVPRSTFAAHANNHGGEKHVVAPNSAFNFPYNPPNPVAPAFFCLPSTPNSATSRATASISNDYQEQQQHQDAANANVDFAANAPSSPNVAAPATIAASPGPSTPSSNIKNVVRAFIAYGEAVNSAMGRTHPHNPHVRARRIIFWNEFMKMCARDAELDKREAALSAKMRLAGDKEARVQMRFKDLEEAEDELKKRRQNFKSEQEELKVWEKETADQFEEREVQVEAREADIEEREANLAEREANYEQREANLKECREKMAEIKAIAASHLARCNEFLSGLDTQVEILEQDEGKLAKANAQPKEKLAKMESKEQKRIEALADLQELEVVLNIRQKRLDAKTVQLMASEEIVTEKEKELDRQQKELEKLWESSSKQVAELKKFQAIQKQESLKTDQLLWSVETREKELKALTAEAANKQIENANIAADLARREADLKHDQDALLKSRKAFEEESSKQTALNEEGKVTLEKREGALETAVAKLIKDKTACNNKQVDLGRREQELNGREESLKKQEESLRVKVEKADQRVWDLGVRAEDLKEQEVTLKSREKDLDAERVDLVCDKKEVCKFSQELRRRKQKLDGLERDLNDREKALQSSEQKAEKSKRNLSKREKELDEREANLDERERELDEGQDDLDADEQTLGTRDGPDGEREGQGFDLFD